MGWYETVKDGIFEALCAAFNLNPDGDGLNRFIPAYTNDAVTPQAPRNKDVAYFSVERFPGSTLDYIEEKQVLVNGLTKTQLQKSVPASVLITFYGPNADDDAEFFWSAFQRDGGQGSPRGILRGKRIVPIGKAPDRPTSVYEVEGTYQRRRSDVRVNLAYLDVTEYTSSEITIPPEVVIRTN